MTRVLLVALLLLAGCAGPRPSTVDGTASCVPAGPSAVSGPSGGPRVPDVTLACLSGTGSVRLPALHRPVIVNLWASWCGPCRAEMPALQAYHARAGDRVTVIGVDTADTRTAGTALLADLGVTYPMLVDDQRRLLTGVGRSALPVTLFVDAGGGLRYLYNSTPLDEPAIARLAAEYLGVAA